MKRCSYCGREESEEVSHCAGCGTEFVQDGDQERAPDTGPELSWVRMAVLYLAVCVFGATLYLLSLGPVLRYCGKVSTATTTTTTGNLSITRMRTIKHPGWVGIVYYPAFRLLSVGALADVYTEYLEWWQRPGN